MLVLSRTFHFVVFAIHCKLSLIIRNEDETQTLRADDNVGGDGDNHTAYGLFKHWDCNVNSFLHFGTLKSIIKPLCCKCIRCLSLSV